MRNPLGLIQQTVLGDFAAEITFFLFKIAESMLEPTVRLFIYEAICLNHFPPKHHHHDDLMTSHHSNDTLADTCSHLSLHPSRQLIVQHSAAQYLMYYKLLLNFPAMLLVLCCGAWSDRAGRKLPIILTCFGTTAAVVLYMASIYVGGRVPFLPLLLIGAAVRGSFGRSAVMTMAVHSYVSDNSAKERRTQKLSNLVAMSHFGYLVGSMCAGMMLDHYGFTIVFLTVTTLQAACVLTAALTMRGEAGATTQSTAGVLDVCDAQTDNDVSVTEHVDERTPLVNSKVIKVNLDGPESSEELIPSGKLLDESSLENSVDKPVVISTCQIYLNHLVESFAVFLRPRPGNARCHLIMLFIAIYLQQMMKSGEADVLLLYVERSPLELSKSMYGYLLSVNYACLGLCAFLAPRLLVHTLHLSDGAMAMIGLLFRIAGLAVLCVSQSVWMLFLSIAIAGPHSMTVSSAKSLISKNVCEGEMGKTFSLLSSGETLSNLVGTVVFANLYSATLALFPGTAFIVEALVFLLIFFMILHVKCKQTPVEECPRDVSTDKPASAVYTSP